MMFAWADFNNDSLKDWNVTNAKHMECMFFYSIFNLFKQCGHNYVLSSTKQLWRSSFFLKVVSLSQKNDSDINKKSHFLFSKWNFNSNCSCKEIFYGNKNFLDKYNFGKNIPYETEDFFKWFEENRLNIANLNISKEEKLDIDDYLISFNNDIEELNNNI